MRAFIAAVVAASVFDAACGPAFAFDPITGMNLQRFSPPAAVAYMSLPFGAARTDKAAYGFAITSPMLRSYSDAPLAIADTPKLLDLRFSGATPEAFWVSGQVAWAQGSSQQPGAQRLNLLGGIGDLALGLVGTAAAAYGVYQLVKKKCPAVSTTTGGCVKPAS